MKRFLSLIAILVSVSCSLPQESAYEAELSRIDEALSRSEEYVRMKQQKISTIENMLNSRGVTPMDNWVKTTPTGGISGETQIKVSVDENKTDDSRQTVLLFRTGSQNVEIPIYQRYKVQKVEVSDPALLAARKIATVMDEFHTYALEWTPEYIRTFVDGKELFHYNPDDYPKGRNADTWPFNKPFELKLNLAWGGDWGGMYGVDESCLPATYEIDYVRVFQK